MKSAQLEDGDGKPLPEVFLILDPKEAKIIADAVKRHAEANKRSKSIQKLSRALELSAIFF